MAWMLLITHLLCDNRANMRPRLDSPWFFLTGLASWLASTRGWLYSRVMVEKVGYTRPVSQTRPARKAGSVSAPGFAEALARAEGVSGVEGVEPPAGIGAIGAMGVLLGAQEVDEREAKRQKAVKKGRLTLDVLSQLRDALLMGALAHSTIAQLERLVAEERRDNDDPLLNDILNEIEVRAAVELAKLEMSGIVLPSAPSL